MQGGCTYRKEGRKEGRERKTEEGRKSVSSGNN